MKNIINTVLVSLLMTGILMGQKTFNPEEYKVFYNFKTVKQEDNKRLFEVSFITQNLEDKTDEMPVYDAPIKFINELNGQENILATVKTDKKGVARIILPEDQVYLKAADGFIKVQAKFEATDALEEQLEEVNFKDLFLELNVEEIDSVKTVSVDAYTLDQSGEQVPVEAADIAFYVDGMLSKLKINEGAIEEGHYEFEFDQQIPGDKKGNLKIYAMIEENDDFANVVQSKNSNFGTKLVVTNGTNHQLWSSAAPIWMYIVLGILLIGVWINFGYSISNLIKISKENKN